MAYFAHLRALQTDHDISTDILARLTYRVASQQKLHMLKHANIINWITNYAKLNI